MLNQYRLYHRAWIYTSDPDKEQELTDSETNQLLNQGGWLVRNVFDFDYPEPTGFWYLIKDSFGGMDELKGHTTKHRVRRSLELLDYEIVSKSEFDVESAFRVMVANYGHYKYKNDIPKFDRLADRIAGLDETYDLWQARCRQNGELVAWAIVRRINSCAEYQTVKADPSFFKSHFPFYGMYYSCNEYYLKHRKLSYVSDGSRSLSNHSNIQSFLEEKFGSRKAYCHLKVTYKWWLRLIVSALFPFRKYIPNGKVRSLLNMEEMQR